MPKQQQIGSALDAAATLARPDLGNGAAQEVGELTRRILTDPKLGFQYLEQILASREVTVGSLAAADIQAALRQRVADEPVLAQYVEQLLQMAAQSAQAQANPDALLPEVSLERQALAHPHPDAQIAGHKEAARLNASHTKTR